MTAKAALIKALLDGRVLNVLNCTKEIGLTNIAREIPRCIEEPFGVMVSRTHRTGKSRYKVPVSWTDYRLNSSEHNLPGIEKMKEYLQKHWPHPSEIKTNKQAKILQKISPSNQLF